MTATGTQATAQDGGSSESGDPRTPSGVTGPDDDTYDENQDAPLNVNGRRARRMFALFNENDLRDRGGRIAYVNDVIAPESIETSKGMTVGQCERVIGQLEYDLDAKRQSSEKGASAHSEASSNE